MIHPHLERRQRALRRRDVIVAALANGVPAAGAALALLPLLPMFGGVPLPRFEAGLFAVGYLLTLIGVEVGYHRYFSHRAFKTSRPLALLLAVLGATSFQGGVIWWSATHRRHHGKVESADDPHSPRAPAGAGLGTRLGRLLHAHVGWMFKAACLKPPGWEKQAPDLLRDPLLFRVHVGYAMWGMLGLLAPAVAGGLWHGNWAGMLSGFLWGGLLRVFAVNHMVYAANSLCHTVGTRPFRCAGNSRNIALLALPSLGMTLHNNHHGFPGAASLRLRWWDIDPAGILIGLLEKAGLVWDVRRVAPAALAARRRCGLPLHKT